MRKISKIIIAAITGVSVFLNLASVEADEIRNNDLGEGSGYVDNGDKSEIKIVDKNLESALKEAVGFKDTTLTKESLAKITTLNLSGLEITDLSGIENCVNLSSIDISDNHIINYSALVNLKNLKNVVIGNQTVEIVDNILKYEEGEGEELIVTPLAITRVDGNRLFPTDADPDTALISLCDENGNIKFDTNKLGPFQNVSYSMSGTMNFSSGVASDYKINVIQPISKQNKTEGVVLDDKNNSAYIGTIIGSGESHNNHMSLNNLNIVSNIKNNIDKKNENVLHQLGNNKVSINISEKKYEILKDKRIENVSRFRQIIRTANRRNNNGVIAFYKNIGEEKNMKQVMFDCDFFNNDVFSSIVEYDPLRFLKISKNKNAINTGDSSNNNELFIISLLALVIMALVKPLTIKLSHD